MKKLLLLVLVLFFITPLKADNVKKFIDICVLNHTEQSKTFNESWQQLCECQAYLYKRIFKDEDFADLIDAVKDNDRSPKLVSFLGSISKSDSEKFEKGITNCLIEFSPIKSHTYTIISSCINSGKTEKECVCQQNGLLDILGEKNYKKFTLDENFIDTLALETLRKIHKVIDNCKK